MQSSTPDANKVVEPDVPLTKPKSENSNVSVLRAAFPDVDTAVISAVLIASSNNLEKAFDGLLGMSDPNFKPDLPSRPSSPPPVLDEEQERQIMADEQFARQLAASSSRRTNISRERSQPEVQNQAAEHSFMDDDLPVLKENIIQGFNETKMKVGSFISNLRNQYNQRQGNTESVRSQPAGMYHQNPRSSTQYDRDALTLDDDFGELDVRDNTEVRETAIPDRKEKTVNSSEPTHSVGLGPSKGTPSTSRWESISDSKPAPQPFSLGDDDEDE